MVGASEVGKEASELRFHCYLRDRVCRDTCLGRRWHTADLEQYMLESDEWERVVGQPSVLQLPAHGIYANQTAMSSAALHEVRVRLSEREGGSVERAGHCGGSFGAVLDWHWRLAKLRPEKKPRYRLSESGTGRAPAGTTKASSKKRWSREAVRRSGCF